MAVVYSMSFAWTTNMTHPLLGRRLLLLATTAAIWEKRIGHSIYRPPLFYISITSSSLINRLLFDRELFITDWLNDLQTRCFMYPLRRCISPFIDYHLIFHLMSELLFVIYQSPLIWQSPALIIWFYFKSAPPLIHHAFVIQQSITWEFSIIGYSIFI